MKKHELAQLLAQHEPSNNIHHPNTLHGLGVMTGLFLIAMMHFFSRSDDESSFSTIYKNGVFSTIALLVVCVFRQRDTRIQPLRAILAEMDRAGVMHDADVPEPLLDKIREIVSKPNSEAWNEKYPNIAKTFKAIHARVYVNEVSNWATSKSISIIDNCGSDEINANPDQFQLDRLPEAPLLVLCEYVQAENQRTKSLTDPKHIMPSLRNYSRRLFNASKGQNAWINALINHVVRGQQDQAETLIKKYPELISQNAWVTDFAGRFMGCTAYQRARWDGDWYMWQMMERYMMPHEINSQRAALANSGLGTRGQYGVSFDFQPLLDRYKNFIERIKELDNQQNVSDDDIARMRLLWKAVFQEQGKLPAHILHQFMHPHRSFLVDGGPPKFNELTLPRKTKINVSYLFSKKKGLILGTHFGLLRFDQEDVNLGKDELGDHDLIRQDGMLSNMAESMSIDFAALNRLIQVISNHLEQKPSYNLSSSL